MFVVCCSWYARLLFCCMNLLGVLPDVCVVVLCVLLCFGCFECCVCKVVRLALLLVACLVYWIGFSLFNVVALLFGRVVLQCMCVMGCFCFCVLLLWCCVVACFADGLMVAVRLCSW